MKFEEMKKAFKAHFVQEHKYADGDFCDGDGWCFAVVKNDKETLDAAIHYELILRGVGEEQDCYLEFHFELYKNQLANVRARFRQSFAKEECRKEYLYCPYYSTDRWRDRRPIFHADDLKDRICALQKIVQGALTSINESTNKDNQNVDGGDMASSPPLMLPYPAGLKEIHDMIVNERLCMPAVQRGKVWNAARCATLWDSILRGYSIGAFSVKRQEDGHYALLDGQQRSAAISLAFEEYSPHEEKDHDEGMGNNRDLMRSLLWIDLGVDKRGDCSYVFDVTTTAQPWGYAESSDETSNAYLSISDRRDFVRKVLGEGNSGDVFSPTKPAIGKLYPACAKMPVPFPVLVEYVEEVKNASDRTVTNFKEWCKSKGKDGKWFIGVVEDEVVAKRFSDICEKISAALLQYKVQLLDAGEVADADVALYFRRIGRGGVVPSEEELAYSVLKSRLPNEFRDKIEDIVAKKRLDRSSRVASMAIRYCLSSDESFYKGDLLDAVVRLCRTREEQCDSGRLLIDPAGILSFVSKQFADLIDKVNSGLCSSGLSAWHISQYCQRHDGDVYLFLMMLTGKSIKNMPTLIDKGGSGANLGAIAELLCWYAPNPAYVIRRMIESGFEEGLAQSMRESSYRTPRVTLPLPISKFNELRTCLNATDNVGRCEEWKNQDGNSDARSLISEGYGNAWAYAMLIMACHEQYKQSDKKSLFDYDSLGVWSEDNCPWDYDHIFPHSWVDKLKKRNRALYDQLQWLVNSIGNLSPIPFSVNRSLSDNPRNRHYPLCNKGCDGKLVQDAQRWCCVTVEGGVGVSELIEAMGKFVSKDASEREGAIASFYRATLGRFLYLYGVWYERLGMGKLLADTTNEGNRRHTLMDSVVGNLKKECCGTGKFQYSDYNAQLRPIGVIEDAAVDWYVWEWISVVIICRKVEFELRVNRNYTSAELGVRSGNNVGRVPEGWKTDNPDYWACYRSFDLSQEGCAEILEQVKKSMGESLFV